VAKGQKYFGNQTSEENMKSSKGGQKFRAIHRVIGSIACATIALSPAYGWTPRGSASVGGANFSADSSIGSLSTAGTGGGIDTATGRLKKPAPGQLAPKAGVCRPNVPTSFAGGWVKKKDTERFRAPILNDIGSCDTEKVNSCLDMMARSLSNSQQALVGFDEKRDEGLETAGSLRYTKDDILTIQAVLKSWDDFKSMTGGLSENADKQNMKTENANSIEKILERMNGSGETSPNLSEQSILTDIHLKLSEELAVASEASLDPHFSDYAGARALLASLNPSASAAFSCLVGLKKSGTELPYGKKRVILGYFSGTKYAELGDNTVAMNPQIVAALVGAGALLVSKIMDVMNDARKLDHDSKERAKDRALEREKAGLPPERSSTDADKNGASKPSDGNGNPKLPETGRNKVSGNTVEPSKDKAGGKSNDDDMFKPFPGTTPDYDPKDNKHYDPTLGCDSIALDGLDKFDPKKHPELVREIANPNDISGAWVSSDTKIVDLVNPRDMYTEYENPMEAIVVKKAVITLEDFRKSKMQINKTCTQINTTEDVGRPEVPGFNKEDSDSSLLDLSGN
jgi:hypothetical protein